MSEISYQAVKEHWDDSFKGGCFKYGEGYKIEDERFALLRFRKEILVINYILRGEEIIQNKQTIKRGSFLDIGCGNGKYSIYYSHRFKEVVGVDFSQKSIAIAQKESLKRKRKNIRFHCQDLKKINLKQKFEVIFVGGVLMYINDEDLSSVLQKIAKHLDPKGILILREPFFKDKTLVKKGEYHVVYRSLKDFIKRLNQEGLKIKEIRLNEGYNYGILVDFYDRLLSAFLGKRLSEKIIYNFLAKPWFLRPNYLLLKNQIKSKGYFLVAGREVKTGSG